MGRTLIHKTISERHYGRIALTGRFTGQDGDAVRAIIAAIRGGDHRRWLIDLAGLSFIDSSGIGMLLIVNGEVQAMGKSVALTLGSGQVRKVITLTRITMILPVHETVEAFVESSVPEAALAEPDVCAPGEHPLALAARALRAG